MGGGQAVARHTATQTNHQEPGAISAQNRQGTFGVGSGRFGSGDVSTICEGSRIGLPNKGIIRKGKGMMGMAWIVEANYATYSPPEVSSLRKKKLTARQDPH